MLDRIEMNRMLASIKPGDVIGFSGRSWLSTGINVATFGIPLWGISHVGIMGYESGRSGNLDLFDSTGKYGVGYWRLNQTIREYNGRMWLYRLSRPLFLHEVTRLTMRLTQLWGRKYDAAGAMRAGGALWSAVQGVIRGEDLTSLFCSEFVAEQLSYIGVFPTSNASRWSPNHLVRKMRRMGILDPPVRLK